MENKAILLPIKKKWLDLILAGKKTIEIRKFSPSASTVYLYETKGDGGSGKVLAKCSLGDIQFYECPTFADKREKIYRRNVINELSKLSCVPIDEIYEYAGWPAERRLRGDIFTAKDLANSNKVLWGWTVGDVQRVDLNLSDFGLTRAPQSFCYVKEPKNRGDFYDNRYCVQ